MNWQRYQREILLVSVILFFLVPFFLTNHLNFGRSGYPLKIILDDQIPFISGFVLVYISMYFMVMMPYFLIKDDAYFIYFIS